MITCSSLWMYNSVLKGIGEECGGLDEDVPDITLTNEDPEVITEAEYRQILRQHRKRRGKHAVSTQNSGDKVSWGNS